jgi:hypothetical protein
MMGAVQGEMGGALVQANAAHESLGLEPLQEPVERGGVASATDAPGLRQIANLDWLGMGAQNLKHIFEQLGAAQADGPARGQ